MIKVYKQERWGMFALIITNVAVMAGLIYFLTQHQSRMAIVVFCAMIYCLVLLINFFKTMIKVDDIHVQYQTLFQNKTMRFEDITKIESSAHITGASAHGFHAKYQTILFSNSDKITIGIKTFSKKNLMEFATILVTRCVHANIDKGTRFMMEGKMPSAFIKYK